ncbi:hypothetical protein FUAX_03560 [Fulvitalea axinellae]|uniref:SPOR domain-containing protein n=1 Tax=Fulvitalea axinellae TaxID=1182444 RepID=A0AAU9D0H4_9BACT|nr:hypothetical protein FUAX_03560 [Fulvitalea axinellae]
MKTRIYITALMSLLFACSPKTAVKQTSYHESLAGYVPDYSQEAGEIDRRQPVIAQTPAEHPVSDDSEGLAKQYASFKARSENSYSTMYSIQAYSGTSREKARSIRATILRQFPGLMPKIEWRQPVYRVKVGQYYNRLEAYSTFRELKRSFPTTLIVPDKVILAKEIDDWPQER